jgi:hypothetical protein
VEQGGGGQVGARRDAADQERQYLDELLPHSEIHPLEAGHFAWEQAAEEYGRLVVDWVSGGYRRVEAG